MHSKPSIVIVGAGVGGLGVALALATRGYASTVFEKRRLPDDIDRGDVLHYGTLPILESWGAWKYLQACAPHEFRHFRILDGRGSAVVDVDVARLLGGGQHFTSLRHAVITRALETAARDTGLVTIRRHEACTGLIRTGPTVEGVTTASDRIPADLTVLATGGRSRLRDDNFSGVQRTDYGTAFYNACVQGLPGFRDAGYYVISRNGVMVLVPLPGDEQRIGIQFRLGQGKPRVTADNFAAVARTIFPNLVDESVEVLDAHTYRLSSVTCRDWCIPGAVLVGDAAHVVHPAGGQGMNLALQDAEALGSHLASAAGPEALHRACIAYAAARKREVRRVHRRTDLMGRAAGISRPRALGGGLAMLKAVGRLAPVQRGVFTRIVDVR